MRLTPTFVTRPAFTVIGHQNRVNNVVQIHALWHQFVPIITTLMPIISEPHTSYGVMRQYDITTDQFDYLAGVVTDCPAALPIDCAVWHIPTQHYAVFACTLVTIPATFDAIYRQWLPTTTYRIIDGPRFERYDSDFMGQPDSPVSLYVPIMQTEDATATSGVDG